MDIRPKWLTNELLEEILNSKGNDKVTVQRSEITAATAPGENFASNMYRASVQISRNGLQENISLIIKSELVNTEMNKMTNESGVFGREIDVFNVAIPTINKLLENAAPGMYPLCTAKCFHTYKGTPVTFIVFEDLKAEGYISALHFSGLDMNHCLLAIRSLAVYHAASVAMEKSEPQKLEQLKIHFCKESMRNPIEKLFSPLIQNVALEAENWPECKGQIINALNELSNATFEILYEGSKRDDGDFNVLCHGDAWLNNMMFRYSDDKKCPIDVRFVDFQQSYWTSPAMDLLYFICSNTSLEVLENQNILIDEYHKVLCDTLTRLGYDHLSPKKNHIYEMVEKRHKYGVVCGLYLRSTIFAAKGAELNVEEVLKEEGRIHFSEQYKSNIRSVLQLFHKKGWL